MVIRYEEVIPSPIPGARVQKMFIDSIHKRFVISAHDGYALHDNRCDEAVLCEDTLEPTGEMLYRYAAVVTVNADYDFTAVVFDSITDVNGNKIAINKVGEFGLFAVSVSNISENQTYGAGGGSSV